MNGNSDYYGGITAEQFLFYEIRIAAKFYLESVPVEDAIKKIKEENLFQYPTERSTARMVKSCYKRLDALDNHQLRYALAFSPSNIAKQINLYAIMRWNRIVWDFMTKVIATKYKNLDLNFSKADLNRFFAELQDENEAISKWSESTISKLKMVLVKMLVETQFLESTRSTTLKPIIISDELENGIRTNNDFAALAAFNCLR